ncbi:radical SAM protein [Herbaspirillum sp. RV1423]|uniref:radical SAM protein n=1 Tax=Herbaspirillum sp. RV1423 TaxID=1443993 RepID=UPI0012DEDAE5|nr:radical SAM protein [Herbaspirillum sp. RV1423]
MNDIQIKMELLAFGVTLSESFMRKYGAPYLLKRRAYGNSDSLSALSSFVPQEIYIGDQHLVCAVNIRTGSSWQLDYRDGQFVLVNLHLKIETKISFPFSPKYYGYICEDGFRPDSVVTLYGGAALGIFVYGDCSLVSRGKACHYCSIEPNRSRSTSFLPVISPAHVERSIEISLQMDEGSVTQVMLNGGNFPDLDRSFAYYVSIATAARKAVDKSGRSIPIHLIAFPPKDISLIDRLADIGVEVAFNSEIYDRSLFSKYCPGKAEDGGHDHIFSALEHAVKVLGPSRVFSIFVGGLEPISSLKNGLNHVASLGATPIINVFHNDPQTPLEAHPVSTPAEIASMGRLLQDVYREFKIKEPFYAGCGRNSIDAEAFTGLF